jgi:outer membrane receptor for ferrienterochelin and colicin
MFFRGAFSNQSYEREGRFDDPGKSAKLNKTGYNVKGGLSYHLNENNVIFFNSGFYSRQPYLDNVFVNVRTSNQFISPEVENETITGFEAGYHFKANRFRANFNAYVTDWDNRTLTGGGVDDNGTPDDDTDDIFLTILQRNVRQYHTGGEFDLYYKATDWMTINGFISSGSWVYKGKSDVATFNSDTNELISEEDGINRDGIKLSTAPQFTTGIGVDLKLVQGLSIDARIKYVENHYEFTDQYTSIDTGDYTGAQLAGYALTNAGLTYRFDLGSNKMTFRTNVYNVFDRIAIQQSDRYGYFNTNGRTFNASMRYEF